jgi:hypothetical protein
MAFANSLIGTAMKKRKNSPTYVVVAMVALGSACSGVVDSDSSTPSKGNPGQGGEDGNGDPGSPPAAAGKCSLLPPGLRPLTPAQIGRTLRALVPGAPEVTQRLSEVASTGAGRFSNARARQDLSTPFVEALLQATHDTAKPVSDNPSSLRMCLSQASPSESCIAETLRQFGSRAFRRPFSDEELARYTAFFAQQATEFGVPAAIRQVVQAMLMSGHFLFRTELNGKNVDGKFALNPYELASALSYLIQDGPPDDELWSKAEAGKLPAELEAEANRLIATPATAPGMRIFLNELFGLSLVANADKDPEVFPKFSDQVAKDMAKEHELFVEDAFFGDGSSFESLFASRKSFVTPELASVYGVDSKRDGFALVELPPERHGILTQGAFLALYGQRDETNVVRRGRVIRERLFCENLPQPPPTVNAVPPRPDGQLSQRALLERHNEDQSCKQCHQFMDPLGYLFEAFDGIGQHRSTIYGAPVDARGEFVPLDGSKAIAFKGLPEFSDFVQSSDLVSSCFLSQAYEYAHGRPLGEQEECLAEPLLKEFKQDGKNMKAALVRLATSDLFVLRAQP